MEGPLPAWSEVPQRSRIVDNLDGEELLLHRWKVGNGTSPCLCGASCLSGRGRWAATMEADG